MKNDAAIIEQNLRQDIDSHASVRFLDAKLSPFLSSSYELYEAKLLNEVIVIARPKETGTSQQKSAKRIATLNKALGRPITLYLSSMTRRQRRVLIGAGQSFITSNGDYFLPQLSLSISDIAKEPVDIVRPFTPIQQAAFLYCLYASEQPFDQAELQSALKISSGSASSALSELCTLGLLECTVGGKTGRKKSYQIKDEERFFKDGVKRFGSPIRETIYAPSAIVQDDWLKSGLSALAELSDLLPPEVPEYAISPKQAKAIPANPDESESRCIVRVLKYDPLLFAHEGCVDPATMLLTIDEEDERISLALRQALKEQEWYQG